MSDLNNKRYVLQRLIAEDAEKRMETWEILNVSSGDIETLKSFCPIGFRIFDLVSNKIAYEPKIELLLCRN